VGCGRSCSLTVTLSPPFTPPASGSLGRSDRLHLTVRMATASFESPCLPRQLAPSRSRVCLRLSSCSLCGSRSGEEGSLTAAGDAAAKHGGGMRERTGSHPSSAPSPLSAPAVLWWAAAQRPASRANWSTEERTQGRQERGGRCSGGGLPSRRACAAPARPSLSAPQPVHQRRRARRKGRPAPVMSSARSARALVCGLSPVPVRLLVSLASLPAPLPALLCLASSFT
jgi:hypothetical protein